MWKYAKKVGFHTANHGVNIGYPSFIAVIMKRPELGTLEFMLKLKDRVIVAVFVRKYDLTSRIQMAGNIFSQNLRPSHRSIQRDKNCQVVHDSN